MRTYGTQSAGSGGSSSNLTVGGKSPSTAFEIIRGNDTTPYIANRSVNGSSIQPQLITFPNATTGSNKNGYAVKAVLLSDDPLCTSTFRLHLFSQAPAATIIDGDPFIVDYADSPYYLGYIDFDSLNAESGGGGSAAIAVNKDIRLQIESIANGSIYGQLEILDAYTPISGGSFYLTLGLEQNF